MCEQGMDPPVQYAPDNQAGYTIASNSTHYAPVVQHYYQAYPTGGNQTSIEYYPNDTQQHQQATNSLEYQQFVQQQQQQHQHQQQLQSAAITAVATNNHYHPSSYLVHHQQVHQLPAPQADGYQTDYYQATYHHLAPRAQLAQAHLDYNHLQTTRYYPGNNHYDQAYSQQQQQQLLGVGQSAYEAAHSSAPLSGQRPAIAAITDGREFQAAIPAAHAVDPARLETRRTQSSDTYQQHLRTVRGDGPASGTRPVDQDNSDQQRTAVAATTTTTSSTTSQGNLRRPPAQVGPPGDRVRAVAPNRADAPVAAAGKPTGGGASTRTLLARAHQPVRSGAGAGAPPAAGFVSAKVNQSQSIKQNGTQKKAPTTGTTTKKGALVITRRKNATRETTAMLKDWLDQHGHNPYPTKGEKIMLSIITKMSLTQVSTWFANARRRMKKEDKSHPWINNHHNYANQPTTSRQLAGASQTGPGVSAAPTGLVAKGSPSGSSSSVSSGLMISTGSSSSSATSSRRFPRCAYQCCSQANNGPTTLGSSSSLGGGCTSTNRPGSPQTSRQVESPSTTSQDPDNGGEGQP